MHKLRSILLAFLIISISSLPSHAGPFAVIGVVTSVPADNTTPAGAIVLKGINTIEISGRVTGGSGVLHILRKIQFSPTSYQFRVWAEDRPIDPFERQDTSGYFSTRITLPNLSPIEEFVILNPGGAVTIDSAKPLAIRGINY